MDRQQLEIGTPLESQKTISFNSKKLAFLMKVDGIVFKATGHHLPKGVPGNATFCPMANAFERDVIMGYLSFPNTTGEERGTLREFFARFDGKEFPELIWNGIRPSDRDEKSIAQFRHERQEEADRMWGPKDESSIL